MALKELLEMSCLELEFWLLLLGQQLKFVFSVDLSKGEFKKNIKDQLKRRDKLISITRF